MWCVPPFTHQAERGVWEKDENNLAGFNLVSYSFSGLIFFWLSWSRKNCVYLTLRGWIPWVSTCFAQQENQKEWILNTLRKQICGNTLEMVFKKSLFKWNWSLYNPAKASGSHGASPQMGICSPSQEGPILPFKSPQKTPGSIKSCYSKAHYLAPWLRPPLHHFLTIPLLADIAARR